MYSTKVEKSRPDPHAWHMDGTATNPNTAGLAVEIRDSAQFDELVIKASHEKLVMVDFWANWCGPCHMLAPTLDKIAHDMADSLSLVKVETDMHQELASRYQVRSLPTVTLFKNGTVVDYFMGAQPESEIRKVLSAHVTTEADLLVRQGETELDAGNTVKARDLFLAALDKDSGRDELRLKLAGMLVDEQAFDAARDVLKPVSEDVRHSADFKALNATIELAQQTGTEAPTDLAALMQQITSDPDDLDSRYQLALALLQRQQFEDALQQLLEIVGRDREFDDGAARKTILQVFERLGGSGDLVTKYRRLLAQALH